MSDQTSFFMDLVGGTIGGVAGIAVGQPADTVKVRAQTSANSGAMRIATQLVRKEGFLGLFKGMMAPIVANAPINATVFVVYGDLIRYFAAQQHAEAIEIKSRELDTKENLLDSKIRKTKFKCKAVVAGSQEQKACMNLLAQYRQKK